jgi:hypothetical protein
MQVTIRNERVLRILGFEPSSNPANMMVGLSVRGWIGVIRSRWFREWLSPK